MFGDLAENFRLGQFSDQLQQIGECHVGDGFVPFWVFSRQSLEFQLLHDLSVGQLCGATRGQLLYAELKSVHLL